MVDATWDFNWRDIILLNGHEIKGLEREDTGVGSNNVMMPN